MEINAKKGWVDLYEEPVFTADRLHYFLRLPSYHSDKEGFFRHIAKISVEVSSAMRCPLSGKSSSSAMNAVLQRAVLFASRRRRITFVASGEAGMFCDALGCMMRRHRNWRLP